MGSYRFWNEELTFPVNKVVNPLREKQLFHFEHCWFLTWQTCSYQWPVPRGGTRSIHDGEVWRSFILQTQKNTQAWNFRPSPLFFVYCRMCFLILGRSVGKEKKKKQKKKGGGKRSLEKGKRSLELGRQVSQCNIRGAWKQQDVVIKSTWRQYRKEKSTSWLNSSENSKKRMNHQNCMAKNCLCFGLKWHLFEIMCYCLLHNFFFFENAKIWVGRTTLNREKRGWP